MLTLYIFSRRPTIEQVREWQQLEKRLREDDDDTTAVKLVTDLDAIKQRRLDETGVSFVLAVRGPKTTTEFLLESGCDVIHEIARTRARMEYWEDEPVAASMVATNDADEESDEEVSVLSPPLTFMPGSDWLAGTAKRAVASLDGIDVEDRQTMGLVTCLKRNDGELFWGPWTRKHLKNWMDTTGCILEEPMELYLYRKPKSARCDKWEGALTGVCGLRLHSELDENLEFPVLSVVTRRGVESMQLKSGTPTKTARRWVFDSLCALRALDKQM